MSDTHVDPAVAPPIDITHALSVVAPKLSPDQLSEWIDALAGPMLIAEINTPYRIAAFLGQVAHESAGFTVLSENLNYSIEAMCNAWPTRFSELNSAAAAPYARNPEKLANRVYCLRMGNGDEASSDGWRFRGAGLIQITGRGEQTKFAEYVGKTVDEVSAWMQTPDGAAASACWYWTTRKLNLLADTWSLTRITRAINGGTNGLPERIALCNAALAKLVRVM